MTPRVTVVGGTGFLGQRLVHALTAQGIAVRSVARRAAESSRTEQIVGSIEDPAVIERAVEGVSALVNLVGTTSAKNHHQFFVLHRDAPRQLAAAARRAGVARFIHVSAMGIGHDAPSIADRSKAAGEDAVRSEFPDANCVRPALIYGPGDHFFTLFAALVRGAPMIPLIGGGGTRFQPLHVDDAVETLVRMLKSAEATGGTYGLGGHEIFTFRELIELLCRAIGRRPWLLPVPFSIAEAGAFLTQWLPQAPLTVEQVRLLQTDKIAGDVESAPDMLGVAPRPLESFLRELAINGKL